MSLLDGHVERSESVDRSETCVAAVVDEEGNTVQMVLLGGHVKGGESILRLDIQVCAVRVQKSKNFEVPGQGGNVEGRVACGVRDNLLDTASQVDE